MHGWSGRPHRALMATLALVVASVNLVVAAQQPKPVVPEKLLAGGPIQLVNDLQAAADSRLVFRQFRRDFGRLDRFDEVDDREEAELVGTLSGDPDLAERLGIVGLDSLATGTMPATTKIMLLVIFDARTNNVLYYDAVGWDTRETAGNRASHTLLVQRLKAMLDGTR